MSYIGQNVQPSSIQGTAGDDFDGIATLDNVIRGDLALHTKLINNPTQDVNGNLILSDAPLTGRFVGIPPQTIIIDTQGYQTLQITTNSTFAATGGVLFSNDGITFAVGIGATTAGVFSTALAANSNYTIPITGRFAKITITTAGALTYFLRNSPPQITNQNLNAIAGIAVNQATSQLGVNLVNIGGTANASQAGTLTLGTTAATNGMTLGTLVAPLTVAATVVKATAGKLYSISVGNAQTTAVYLKVYNAASVTLGTTSAIQNYLVPGGTAGGTFNVDINDTGLYFSTGICIAVTGGQGLLDSTALTTAAVVNYSFI